VEEKLSITSNRLSSLFGVNAEQAKASVKPLVAIGFLEVIKGSFKVPSLFREGMKITQGKAFEDSSTKNAEDEDDE
jgi:hypothetical protein